MHELDVVSSGESPPGECVWGLQSAAAIPPGAAKDTDRELCHLTCKFYLVSF